MTTPHESSEWTKDWNPFNHYKLLAQVYRWKQIKQTGKIPQPALVTVDPINKCNYTCSWCNARKVMDERNNRTLSSGTLNKLADFLPRWQGSPDWPAGVGSVCIAGGGEPLLNKSTGGFIERLAANKIGVGLITNGSFIGDYTGALCNCTWVGVSVDAGTKETLSMLKNVKPGEFDKVINGVAELVDNARRKQATLSQKHAGYGVSYKYLLHPGNAGEVYQAARIAKDIGCKNFHLRPYSAPHDRIGARDEAFTETDIAIYKEQVRQARELEDANFGVYCITRNFDSSLKKVDHFNKCHAIFMTALFMPGSDGQNVTFGLCCDRRGDEKVEIEMESFEDVPAFWGSDEHWKIFDLINSVRECPRCTYNKHNEIFEKVVQEDNMTFGFI